MREWTPKRKDLRLKHYKTIGTSIWQRSYYDHVIRNEKDYEKIWEYIDTNVLKWKNDCYY